MGGRIADAPFHFSSFRTQEGAVLRQILSDWSRPSRRVDGRLLQGLPRRPLRCVEAVISLVNNRILGEGAQLVHMGSGLGTPLTRFASRRLFVAFSSMH